MRSLSFSRYSKAFSVSPFFNASITMSFKNLFSKTVFILHICWHFYYHPILTAFTIDAVVIYCNHYTKPGSLSLETGLYNDEVEAILKHYFKNVECSVLGIGKTFSVYRYYECSSPRKSSNLHKSCGYF